MKASNRFLFSQDSMDSTLKFCFEDDILADHASRCTTRGTLSFSGSASDFPIISLPKPAKCVVTRDSARAELTCAKSSTTEYHEKGHNFNRFVDQVFEINYDITMTNSNLVSKFSDLQLENMSLVETIAKMKVHHFQENEDLKNALRKAKHENYEMSRTNSDLSLANVDYRKQTIQLRNENRHLKNINLGDVNLNKNCNENESQKMIEGLLAVNKDLNSRLIHITTGSQKLEDEIENKERNSDSFCQQQLYIKILENESVTLKEKLEELEASYKSASRKSLLVRIQELKELQKQLNRDADFIKNAQQLQIENENYLSELAGLQREYDELREKFIIQRRRKRNTDSEIGSHSGGSTDSLTEISTSSEFTNGIFDQTALSPQTATTEKPSRWRRFYRTGSLSSWNWSSKFHKTKRLSPHLLEVNTINT